ncbi:XRE family transcriptional regulator [Rhodococcus qingshengii]|nr:XRE family transcriptional regulator [Rhodococcus qingshengii]
MARRRVSQAALAIHLGISQSSVSRRLQGDQPFDVTELTRAAELFEVPVQNLLGPLLAA